MNTIADRVKWLRDRAGLSQNDLADRLGVKQQNIQQLEAGDVLSPRYLVQLAQLFKVDPIWLGSGKGQPPDEFEGGQPPEFDDSARVRPGNHDARMMDIQELDVMLSGGPGSVNSEQERVVATWRIPRTIVRTHTTTPEARLKIVRVGGDSMMPEYPPGERVLVDADQTMPSPAGVFAIWDGFAEILKRIEIVPYSDPPMLELSSINPAYPMRTYRLDEVTIKGRVIGKWDWKG